MKNIILVLNIFFLLFPQEIYAHENHIDEFSDYNVSDFHFTENKGQLDSGIKYHCKLHIGDIFFKDNQFSFDLFSAAELDKIHDLRHNHLEDSSSSFVFNNIVVISIQTTMEILRLVALFSVFAAVYAKVLIGSELLGKH